MNISYEICSLPFAVIAETGFGHFWRVASTTGFTRCELNNHVKVGMAMKKEQEGGGETQSVFLSVE